ncbi:MAG TPA: lipid-A-disaccharide synthase, partial [Vulgatibacter sp.]
SPLLEQPALRELPDRGACRRMLGLPEGAEVLALLPGSRRAEVGKLLPPLLDAADRLAIRRPGLRVVVPIAPTLDRAFVQSLAEGRTCRPLLVTGRSLEAMGAADAVALCSGTATLEAALLGRPMVVVYKAHPASILIARLLAKVRYFSIVNLLAGRPIVPELLQEEVTGEAIEEELAPLLDDTPARREMLGSLAELRDLLGSRDASDTAAREILQAAGLSPTSEPSPGLLRQAGAL